MTGQHVLMKYPQFLLNILIAFTKNNSCCFIKGQKSEETFSSRQAPVTGDIDWYCTYLFKTVRYDILFERDAWYTNLKRTEPLDFHGTV